MKRARSIFWAKAALAHGLKGKNQGILGGWRTPGGLGRGGGGPGGGREDEAADGVGLNGAGFGPKVVGFGLNIAWSESASPASG